MTTYRGPKALFRYASALKGFPQKADKPLVAGLLKGIREAQKRARKTLTRRGIGRRIWGKDVTAGGGLRRRSNLNAFFKLQKIRRSGDHFTGGFKLSGIPRLVELGGRIKAHDIPKKRGGEKLLVFDWPRAGGTKAARRVRHPGGPVRYGRDFADRELRAAEDDVKRFTQEALLKAAAKAGL